ncbi:hypothetical protein PEPS_42880 (plasmid) [Persicobacter psychrovividus]|uniref:Alpha-L-rhamnosidase six-hairpin glycosidase domain-containing protein n=2 Tax=Persicobacter psychrovividus TaxID=387638 RepID=A0ABN6LJA7_9BACT|nr:hypothetical protein PEPS_42880 [Persicobacter psychrovividus]
MIRNIFFLIFLCVTSTQIFAQQEGRKVKTNRWAMDIHPDGYIKKLTFHDSGHEFTFNHKEFMGPSWYLKINGKEVEMPQPKYADGEWVTSYDYVDFGISFSEHKGRPMITARIKSNRPTAFQPTTAGLRMGVDTYMDHFPYWNKKTFPTLLRAEKTHFWGYLMSPEGKILSINSPDPIASWSHEYTKKWGQPPYWFFGHRIASINLDLINALPLPSRHPQHLYQIEAGQEQVFRIYLDEVKSLNDLQHNVQELTEAPVINLPITAGIATSAINFEVKGACSQVNIIDPSENTTELKGQGQFSFAETDQAGAYHIIAKNEVGKTTEALYYVRKPYSWYMQQAMTAVLDYPQKASMTHCESWYGFYSTYAGGKHFPNHPSVQKADEQFHAIYPIIFDTLKFEPKKHGFRIQNVSTIIGVLVDRYQLYNDPKDLDAAVKYAEFLLASQSKDGAYRARSTHYTSVIYIAKSLMELLEVLDGRAAYAADYKRIFKSVTRSMDELAANGANIQTEGEQTFEDGMISCSAAQLGQFALMFPEGKKRERYKMAALDLLDQHRCLEQLMIPDARMRMGSMRFWEAQYDVLMANNFINSPHGWSAWTTYAQYYAYLLTGEHKYLQNTFNGLNSGVQSIDLEGKLHWGFMVNPYVKVTQMNRNIEGANPLNVPGQHYNAFDYSHDTYTMGEGYVNMVSDWFFGNSNDNDVHEHFKCLAEIALDKAYVFENRQGNLEAYNCQLNYLKEQGYYEIKLADQTVSNIHMNLRENHQFKVGNQNIDGNKGAAWYMLKSSSSAKK